MSAKPVNRTARAGKPLAVQAMEGTFAPKEIRADALLEQLSYRAAGNPPGTLPTTAISNCFPGLEFDFRNVWKNIFKGIELHESDNLVVAADEEFATLLHRRLVKIRLARGEQKLITILRGPRRAGGPVEELGFSALEWTNALALVVREAGEVVTCEFTPAATPDDEVSPDSKTEPFQLEVRAFFEPGTAVIARDLASPGQLTQSLCSPWQNDYRECACYYWAASRPDFVNAEVGPTGTSAGENWMQVRGVSDGVYRYDEEGEGTLTYEDMFRQWETVLRFEIRGRDSE